MMRKRAKPEKIAYARRMRENPTPAERAMWLVLSEHRLAHGVKWRRQCVILGWIVDFYCPSRRLVVELDGAHHADDPRQKALDTNRADVMRTRCNIHTMRMENRAALANPKGCGAFILSVALARPIYATQSALNPKPGTGENW